MTDANQSVSQGWRAATLAVAGLCGAAGVALAALAAHRVQSPALAAAAQMLMLHAGAAVAIAAVSMRAARQSSWLAAAAAMLAGAVLFGGDIALSTFAGRHLFPMAAPTGGTLMIASWLSLAVIATIDGRGT